MALTPLKKTPQSKIILQECALTGGVFDGRITPLCFKLTSENGFEVSLSGKAGKNQFLLDPDPRLIADLLNGVREFPLGNRDFLSSEIFLQIIELYRKRIYSQLTFMLKSNQAIIGRRAIERALYGVHGSPVWAILVTSQASEAICKNFEFKQKGIKFIHNFPEELLQRVSGRDKISYCSILDTDIGRLYINDYKNYLRFSQYSFNQKRGISAQI